MRDNFSKETREKLAKEAGYCCANPGCRRKTVGATEGDLEGVLELGECAHIHAASPGGARYDENQTSDERKSARNGIYLCRVCARAIDRDEKAFPADLLRKWKGETRRLTFLEATQGRVFAPPIVEPADLKTRALEASRADIATFMTGRRWPAHPVKLSLHLLDGDDRHTFDADGLAKASRSFADLVVVAPPGTGKSTSLVQVANALTESGDSPAGYLRLGEWSAGSISMLDHIAARRAFRRVSAAELADLAELGSLTLLLDGWNELSPEAQGRARTEIESLRRQFSKLRLVLSTRRQALQVPLDGPPVELGRLSDDQQFEIANALRGEDGKRLVDQAWRIPGLHELMGIPLYLNAILKRVKGALPRSRDEILALFVAEHEEAPEDAAVLRSQLQELQTPFLAGLAVQATASETTVLTQAEAVAAISAEREELLARGLAAALPQPLQILDVLVDHHCLVREAGATRAIGFQHQQIQEWYASQSVARLMLDALGDADAAAVLRQNHLNIYAWEEPVLFACERLSQSGARGEPAVAQAIDDALKIDPMLAAEMIARSSEAVWALVGRIVLDFANAWHEAGQVDRAFRFVMITGRPEFGDLVWPLLTSEDQQTQLHALRAGDRFKVSILGDAPEARIKVLPEEVRERLLSEIASNGGFDGIDLATAISRDDPSAALRLDVIQSLAFRRADRAVMQVMERANAALWDALAKKDFPEELIDAGANARLQEMRGQRRENTASMPNLLAEELRRPVPDPVRVAELIEDPNYPMKDDHAMTEAVRRLPAEAGAAVVKRLEAKLPVPFRIADLLRGTGLHSDQPAIGEAIFDPSGKAHDPEASAAASVAGPATIERVLDQLLAVDAEIEGLDPPYPEGLADRFHRYKGLLSVVDGGLLVDALAGHAGETDPRRIRLLSDVVASVGGHPHDEDRLEVPQLEKLAPQLEAWGELLLGANTATRGQMAEVAEAIGRTASPTLLPLLTRLLIRDLERWRQARADLAAGKNRGRPLSPEVSTDHTGQYSRALAAIGNAESVEFLIGMLTDLDFGHEAAVALLNIWERTTGRVTRVTPFPFFAEARRQLLDRQQRQVREPVHLLARPILDVVERFSATGMSEREQAHAFKLASIVLAFPHGDDTAFCERLLDLDGHRRAKLNLLTSMVASGRVISAERLLAGVVLLFEDAKTQSWLIEGNGSELPNWIHLFAYSDRPEAVLDVLQGLKEHQRAPYSLHSLLNGLGKNPSPSSERLLAGLAGQNPKFRTDYEWVQAVMAQGTVSALDLLLEAVTQSEPGGPADRWSLARKLAAEMEQRPDLREPVYERYASTASTQARDLLEHAISESPDEGGVIAIIDRHAADGRPANSGGLRQALRHMALGEQPSERGQGWQEIIGVPLISLRKHLFAMTAEAGSRGTLAAAALTEIDGLRDDYGRVEEEPRHPDIRSGRPWPPIVKISNRSERPL